MDDGELVGSPDGEDDEKNEAREIDCAASAEAGVAADVDHADVGEPHGEGQEDLGVEEIGRADGLLGDKGADEETGGHTWKAEEEGPEGDLVGGFERRQPRDRWRFLLETTLLNEVEKRGQYREEQSGVSSEKKSDVEEDPAGVKNWEGGVLLARMKRWDQTQKKADWQKKDAKKDRAVPDVDEEERQGKEKAKEGLSFVCVYRKAMMGRIEHLGQRNEMEEHCSYGGGDGDVAPARAVIKGHRQNRKRGDAVERDRNSEPEERHR